METVTFNQELTLEDKYHEFDVNLRVTANIKEEKAVGYPTELIVDLVDVIVEDWRDVTPFEDGQDMMKELDHETLEWLKDLATERMI